MKRIGILGGMSWESSIVYEQIINRFVRAELGGVASADLLVRSFNFADIEALQSAGRWDEAGSVLALAATELEQAGAELIVLATNTMHQVADSITEAIGVPLIHIADPTGEAITALSLQRVALLGTRYTMERGFYRDRLLEQFGVESVVPLQDERERLQSVIYDELVQGVVSPESKQWLVQVINRMAKEEGIQGVIAGCTEIELLIGQDDVAIPFFPTTTLHATAAARRAIEN